MTDRYTMFGAEASYYTGKARAYLRYKDIPYDEYSGGTPQVQAMIKRTGVMVMPTIHTPDDIIMQDTTEIIDFLEERFAEPSVYPETPRQRLAALLFELFGDEWMIIPGLYYRWIPEENLDFVFDDFGSNSAPFAGPKVRYNAGKMFGSAIQALLPSFGVVPEAYEGIERMYEDFLNQFSAHLEKHPFLFGTRPSIGDYGLMAPLYAHLSRDPFPAHHMRLKAPGVLRWVERMNFPKPRPKQGDFLSDDEVPETLYPILQTIFEEQFPVLQKTVEDVARVCDDKPDKVLPRFTSTQIEYTIGGKQGSMRIHPYTQWMLQRPIDYYQSLGGTDKESVDAMLKEAGGYEHMQMTIPRRVKRDKYKLWPE